MKKKLELMTQQQVLDLMKSSKNEEEWDQNCDAVSEAFGGYPDFWNKLIIASGVASQVLRKGEFFVAAPK